MGMGIGGGVLAFIGGILLWIHLGRDKFDLSNGLCGSGFACVFLGSRLVGTFLFPEIFRLIDVILRDPLLRDQPYVILRDRTHTFVSNSRTPCIGGSR
ncbi:hypothetical protein [Paenibacillus sp. GP183]|uniref:hypothetical protein n=1 Tax=Paenibacillus sp. GP183 TaxID=1882751 RepID=UPI000896E329|nr:hypothetical protein [Paenibacillus sp. GP183]SEB67615.1 hypothetical protein SAMN05443246_1539 [Paenibacillus sp. GP183]